MIKRFATGSIANSEPATPEGVAAAEQRFQQVKTAIHQDLVASLDLSQVGRIPTEQMQKLVQGMAEKACKSRALDKAQIDRDRLQSELMDEIFGLGPLEALMHDPSVTDILVNDANTVYVERNGQLELTSVVFADEQHLLRIIQRIVARIGRRIDEVSPMVDARLPDGSRVNAVIRPLAIDGPSLSIRRFGRKPMTMENLLSSQTLTPEMRDFLAAAVEARIGMVISGGTGAGKTTLLNSLSRFIPGEERIVTIEDSAELILQHRHRVRMETRPANTEGAGEVSQRDLVRNALRMRPDRIIVGEARGAEVWDMLQAMNTGHEGSLTTVHANSTQDALTRLEMMVAMTGFELPISVVRQYIAAGAKLLVHMARLKGGARRITQISEIVKVENGEFQICDLFRFEVTGQDASGNPQGRFVATGVTPHIAEQLAAVGWNV